MIKHQNDLRLSITEQAKGGHGSFINHHILEKDELYGKGRYYALCRLAPGDSVGLHTHHGEMEVCYFLSGTGIVRSGSLSEPIAAGDTNIVLDDEEHEVVNNGSEDLVYTALIIYK